MHGTLHSRMWIFGFVLLGVLRAQDLPTDLRVGGAWVKNYLHKEGRSLFSSRLANPHAPEDLVGTQSEVENFVQALQTSPFPVTPSIYAEDKATERLFRSS